MAQFGTHARLFESALNDVRYVYGRPLRYSSDPHSPAQRAIRGEADIFAPPPKREVD